MSESLLSSLDSLSETIFGSAHSTVMHSDAIIFLFYKTIADWPNYCKHKAGLLNFTPFKKTYSLKKNSHSVLLRAS